jgi:IS6 family transposase
MATLSRRHHHVVCARVSALPHLGGTDGRDDEGKRSGHQPQLCVALGADLRPALDKRCRRHRKPTNRSGRVAETYIKVKGQERFRYRAVDSSGQTIDFLLTAKRDTAAAKRFYQRGMANPVNSLPRVINVDKNRAYPAAVDELNKDGAIPRRCKLRQCKYLNNVVEQDHRNVKCRTWLAKGYGSVRTAWRTLRGIEAMGMIGKGRVRRVGKGDVVAQVKFISKLFGIAA